MACWPSLWNSFRSNDESPGRRTNEVERVTGDQSQDLIFVRSQYRDIVRAHDLGRDHSIAVLTKWRGQRDQIVSLDISQRTKKRIAVAGDSYVSALPRQSRTFNVTGRAPKRRIVRSFHDYYRDAEAQDLHPADQSVRTGAGHRFH